MDILQTLLKKLNSFDRIDLEDYIPNLAEKINAPWIPHPTPHIIFDDLFTNEYAHELTAGFKHELKRRGCSDSNDWEKFSRMYAYDAYNYTPKPSLASPFRVFFSQEWYQFFKRISGHAFDDNIMTSLHHHARLSESGYVHSDYGIYAFRRHPFINELNHWYHNSQYQAHKPGVDLSAQGDVVLTRRSTVLIYYLDSAVWHEGDGGETALFKEKGDSHPMKIAPKFNRLLAFTITPHSFHAFMQNIERPRNTIIQWFHEPFDMPGQRKTI